jgi:hypothetical protein
MTPKIVSSLHRFFDGLDADLCFGLAAALAKKINAAHGTTLSSSDVFREYENWQAA